MPLTPTARQAQLGVIACLAALASTCADLPGGGADDVARYAAVAYGEAAEATLADLVAFRTVYREGTPNSENPEFRAMNAYLGERAAELGFGFADHGEVVVISLGEAEDRLGLFTHGDVQPADPGKWAADPFVLDTESEPGRLVGRGVEDDKGPIAAALYAMAAVRDREVPLARRIELVVSNTEESDWAPFQAFLRDHPPPDLNVSLDAEYPVVSAEKGWGVIRLTVPPFSGPRPEGRARLIAFTGGRFLSQIPEDARAVIAEPRSELVARLREATAAHPHIRYRFSETPGELTIEAKGEAAHSSKPWSGRNAVTHLAALLAEVEWPDGQVARMVRLIDDLVGTGNYADRFGELGYAHPFMGSLTLSLTVLEERDDGLSAGINIRRPAGPTNEEVDRRVRQAVAAWQERSGISELEVETMIFDPYWARDAPHVPTLLRIFERYSGLTDAEALSMGGGTHARLLPNGVNFGPAMPGTPYSGHSEHEYMEREHFRLSLEMYAALRVELAGAR
jgi:dipeptidase D